jgi:hypothetical protein
MSLQSNSAGAQPQRLSLLRVSARPRWALGVGIVLVGEYMGWNFSIGKGGMIAGLVACWVAGVLLHLRRDDRFGGDLHGRRRRRQYARPSTSSGR